MSRLWKIERVLKSHVTCASRWNCPKSKSDTLETTEVREDNMKRKSLLSLSLGVGRARALPRVRARLCVQPRGQAPRRLPRARQGGHARDLLAILPRRRRRCRRGRFVRDARDLQRVGRSARAARAKRPRRPLVRGRAPQTRHALAGVQTFLLFRERRCGRHAPTPTHAFRTARKTIGDDPHTLYAVEERTLSQVARRVAVVDAAARGLTGCERARGVVAERARAAYD